MLPLLRKKIKNNFVNMYNINLIILFLIFQSAIALQKTTNFNLKADVVSGKSVNISWNNNELSKYSNSSKINLKLISFNEKEDHKFRIFPIDNQKDKTLMINDLIPGGTYEAILKVDLNTTENLVNSTDDKLNLDLEKNSIYESFNFTTKPNSPGRFIVWFRNTTSLLILWQPAYPSGIFDKYKVSIEPPDSFNSLIYVDKESEPPGPSQASFYGLIPGRAYTINVEAISKDQTSKPMIGRYRTVPLPPDDITVDLDSLDTTSFAINWKKPKSYTEFDRYQASITLRSTAPQIIDKDAPKFVRFSENLEPGRAYEITLKTVSGNVASYPVTKNVTTKPLPVLNLFSHLTPKNEIELKWVVSNESQQDSFIIRYHDHDQLNAFNSDGTIQVVKNTKVLLQNLLHGCNYTIFVQAVSNGIRSNESITYQTTKPGTPVIETLESVNSLHTSLNVSWKSDVTSRQDEFKITYMRKDQLLKSKMERKTKNNWIVLEDLYPGAVYSINVSAISYGLSSEPHQYIQTIYPKSPESLQLIKASNSTVIITWIGPSNSIIDNYIVRYRPISSTLWRESAITNITSNEINDLMPGEKYIIKVNTISNKVESVDAKEIEQTMYPNGVESVSHIISSTNITFKLMTPLGRIDYYIIVYSPTNEPSVQENSKQILPSNRSHFGDTVTAVVDGLKPGELYSFKFYSISHNLRSEALTIRLLRTKPVINSVINIVTYEQETRTLGVKFSPTPRRLSTFDRYRFQLTSDLSIPAQEKLHNDTSRLVLFDNLVPGRLYNLSVYVISGGVYSEPQTREIRLYPGHVKNLQATRITDSEIQLSWSAPEKSDKDGYEITYLDQQISKLIRNFTFFETITYSNLKPYMNYSFEVITISGFNTSTLLRSSPVSQTFTTLESKPGKLSVFHPINVTPNEITFEWHLPANEYNGVLTGFEIKYFIKNSFFNQTNVARFDATATQGTIDKLQSGVHYVFVCSAYTKVGSGSSSQYELEIPVWAPPKSNYLPIEVGKSARTIKIQFKKNFFSNAHGSIKYYAIIVTEDPTNTASYFNLNDDLELPSWFDVQGKSVWPTYQTTEYFNPFETSSITEFVVGADSNCEKLLYQNDGHKNVFIENISPTEKKAKYCNGPLKPSSSFRIKIRAFTGPKKFTDTVYSPLIITEPDNKTLLTTILILLSFLLLILLIFVIYKRRQFTPLLNNNFGLKRHQPKSNLNLNQIPANHLSYHSGLTLTNTLMSNSLLTKSSFENESFNANISEAELINDKKIKLVNFADHFRMLSRDSDYLFSFQFEQLRNVGKDSLCTAADLPVNRPKNRFTNILPYDHSRVKLSSTDDEDGSDYINANYVPGFNSPREYLVTQGPLHSTRDDFWRMIWEQNSRAIVMLTKCTEKGREKCDHYWPFNTQPVFYGDIEVILMNESKYSNWVISEFKVSRNDQSRTIKHFHFTSWPDFGIPSPPSILTRFVRTFRERVPPDSNKPITVHCSAGIGRSGTFIALDRVLQDIKEKDYVNIFKLVYEMRKCRTLMVQTEQQYICIHQCLLSVLDYNNSNNKQDLIESPEINDNHAFVEDDEGIAESHFN